MTTPDAATDGVLRVQESLFDDQQELVSENGSRASVERYEYDSDEGVLVRVVTGRDGREVETAVLIDDTKRDADRNDDLGRVFDQRWLRSDSWPLLSERREDVRVVDLFSGCGGMTLGVWEACRALGLDMTAALAVDSDSAALEVFDENLEPEEVDSRGVEELLDGELGEDPTPKERELINRVGDVTVLVAGPPCQGHSDLNNRTRRDDPKNRLFLKIARFAELFKPDHVIVENVEGILHDRGDVFHRTKQYLEIDLEELEYSVDGGKIEADGLGVAQHRHRVFLVASRSVEVSLEEMVGPFIVPTRDFRWACGDLEDSIEGGAGFDSPANPAPVTKKRIEYLFKHDLHELPDSQRPPCHRDKKHTYPSVYGRMWLDRPSPTITTGFTAMGQGRFVHPARKRTITPHEAARLQFFPDFFDFGVRTRKAYQKLIGNAVPPKFCYVLALQLLR